MIGQTLAHYEILEKIGQGGMGEVYPAQDTKLDRKVALKVLPPELAESQERRARFKREANAIAALNHANIITIQATDEIKKVTDVGRHPLWLNDGRRLVFTGRDKLFLLDVESGQQRELFTRPNTQFIQSLALARDNRTIYFLPMVIESDIWLLTLNQDP